MIPAWVLASEGKMYFWFAFLAWTLGALFWASINYGLWYYLWGPIIKNLISRFGKYIFVSWAHYEAAEKFFQKHGSITTFTGRFIPAVRQLISLPAGVFQMNIPKFLFFTWLWAGIWNLILLSIGYIAWENKALISQYSHFALLWVLGGVAIVAVIYYVVNRHFLKD